MFNIRHFFLHLLVGSAALAMPPHTNVEGRLVPTQGQLPPNLSVEFITEGRFVEKVPVSEDGSFYIRNIPVGSYEIRIVNGHGDALRREYLTLSPHSAQMELRIPGVRQDRPAIGSISYKALLHPVPRGARKDMKASDKAFRKGDLHASIDHLKRALAKCTDCFQIHNNLGARYMRTGAYRDAVAAFRQAAELDPASATVLGNLAIALVTVQEFAEADAVARRALSHDAALLPAKYALGLSAVARKNCTTEAVDYLRAAAEHHPRAHLSVAAALECRGDANGAIEEIKTYLATPNAERRTDVEQWLTRLRQHTGSSSPVINSAVTRRQDACCSSGFDSSAKQESVR